MEQYIIDQLPKDKLVFLGKQGLSQTEANHKADIVKAKVAQLERSIKQTSAYKETAIIDGKEVPLNAPVKVQDFKGIALSKGKLYALSSWLREGVFAKESVIDFLRKADRVKFLTEGESFQLSPTNTPVRVHVSKLHFGDSNVIGKWSIGKRNDYLTAVAMASHIGKLIHNENGNHGVLKNIMDDLSTPTRLKFKKIDQSPENLPVKLEPLYEVDQLDAQYMELQKEHRSWEQKVNALKAEIKNELADLEMQEDARFMSLSQKFHKEYEVEMAEYLKKVREVNAFNDALGTTLESRRTAAVKEASAWKIVIPNDLEDLLGSITE